MKSIIDIINESKIDKTIIHFENPISAALFEFELKGQISDGKYENSKPYNHWKWVSNAESVVDGESYYEGPRQFSKIQYNLNDWVKYMDGHDSDWAFTVRVLYYAKLMSVMSKSEANEILADKHNEYSFQSTAEAFGNALEKNPNAEFSDIEVPEHRKKYLDNYKYFNKEYFDKFKKSTYSINDVKADLKDMSYSVNTNKSEL